LANSKLLIDTSVIIDFLRKKDKRKSKFWRYINKYDCYISIITHFELFCGANTKLKRAELEKLLNFLTVINFNTDISFQASNIFTSLKKQNKLIEFRDIFIASTAMSLKIPLATLNKKHFDRVKGIKLLSN